MFRSLVATLALLASASAAEPVQVHVTGATQADGQLLQDILRQVALYGVAFNCPAPSDVHIGVIAASRVPLAAEYRAPSAKALYEEWDATFCGKEEPIFVTFWPDPNGGSFTKVTWPYPDGAPRGHR